jgi:peptidoglycan-associated lipoprotein
MFFYRTTTLRLFIGLALFSAFLGCPKKPAETASQNVSPQPTQTQPAPPPAVETAPPAEQHPVTEEAVTPREPAKVITNENELKDIFFDFDRAVIKPEMKDALNFDVTWLKSHGSAKVLLEGHCDERGTNEYNLALGEKRAYSVKKFLLAQGIKPVQLSTISYGEDRPFCKEQTEACYQQNRRVHFTMK